MMNPGVPRSQSPGQTTQSIELPVKEFLQSSGSAPSSAALRKTELQQAAIQIQRTVVVVSADASLRQRLREALHGLRWRVREAGGGAAALAQLEEASAEALLLDSWLPDLEVDEFAACLRQMHPEVDLLRVDGGVAAPEGSVRSPRRNELLHALRSAQERDGAAWNSAPLTVPRSFAGAAGSTSHRLPAASTFRSEAVPVEGNGIKAGQTVITADIPEQGLRRAVPGTDVSGETTLSAGVFEVARAASPVASTAARAAVEGRVVESRKRFGTDGGIASTPSMRQRPPFEPVGQSHVRRNMDWTTAQGERPALGPVPEMIGDGPAMRKLARMVRMVAPTTATVLIEGATGSGKEVVAKAVHRLSARSDKTFAVLNCAAIPESLLEAELFGHTRGAFTGAVQARTGRIEAAHGGTLFLDEIGEMPFGLQAKLLRFLDSGELQRVGENEPLRVDVRVIAATHQPLEQRAKEGRFRADLYYRLVVFPIYVPTLAERMEDLPLLAEHFLAKMGREAPVKRLNEAAMKKLMAHTWPGNVRELSHVLERAVILAEQNAEIGPDEVHFGSTQM